MVLNSKIEVRGSAIAGHGLYAKEPIEAGEMVWQAEEDEETRYYRRIEEIRTWTEEQQRTFFNFAYQVSEGVYSGVPPGEVSDNSEYMNHSCDGNCWWEGDKRMVAMRRIEAGEEVTADYATFETAHTTHNFKCACGAKSCRGEFTGKDCLLPALRAKYAGHVAAMVVEYQEEHDKATAAEGAAAT
jgi:SET domain-containing protein